MQQVPDSSLPFEVRSRILDLSRFADMYRTEDPNHPCLASITAIQNAYRSGQLVAKEGMVSFWYRDQQLTDLMPYSRDEYCKWASKYGNGTEEVIWLERVNRLSIFIVTNY